MASGPFPSPFVGAHILLSEPSPQQGGSWDDIPAVWTGIRFDAIDVLFVSEWFIESDQSINLMRFSNGNLNARFNWTVQAARTQNPNIKIIIEQFMGGTNGQGDFSTYVHDDPDQIQRYADSVAKRLGDSYNATLPALNGTGQVSARLDGWDVDVENGNLVAWIPKIFAKVRKSVDDLSTKLGAPRFSVSCCPAWTTYLDSTVPQSLDYINMQNYDGGLDTSPDDYKHAMNGLQNTQLAWGLTSETPSKGPFSTLDQVKAQVQQVTSGQFAGIWAWRVNSDNMTFENAFQVWLFNNVHNIVLPNSTPEATIAQEYATGGR